MTPQPIALDELLRVEDGDPGCNAGGPILDLYVDLEVDGSDATEAYPEWAAHLRSCPACRQDYEGLLEAARLFGD